MKQTTVSVPYPEAKIDALRHFTDSGKPPLEEEITALIDRLYTRNVPAPVREFIAAQARNSPSEGETPRKKRPESARQIPEAAPKSAAAQSDPTDSVRV